MPAADMVELAEDATLEECPEAFDCIGVNIAVHVPIVMFNHVIGHDLVHAKIALIFVCHEPSIGRIDTLTHEGSKVSAPHLVFGDRFGRHLPATLDRANHRRFLGATTGLRFVIWIVIFLAFAGLTAHIRFVHLDNAREQVALFGLGHGLPYLHGNPPGRVLVDLKVTRELEGGKALLRVQHQRNGEKPFL